MAVGGEVAAGARINQQNDPDNREDAKPPAAKSSLYYSCVTWVLLIVIVVLLGLILGKVSHQTEGTGDKIGENYTTEVLEAVEKWMKEHSLWMEKENSGYCSRSPDDISQASFVDNITTAVTNTVEQLLDKHSTKLRRTHTDFTFDSCADVLEQFPGSPSAYYYIKVKNGRPLHVYCDMTLSCGSITGGWRSVAHLNMSEPASVCPPGFVRENPSSCKRNEWGQGCSSVIYPIFGISHTAVCGKVNAFYVKSLDGFRKNSKVRPVNPTINDNYVDGLSLTHYDQKKRTHIWTLAAGPCLLSKTTIPKFVGNHYSFDHDSLTALLWDSIQCPDTPSSHSAWFFRDFKQENRDNIEMRLCRDQARIDEDILLTHVEIYVH